MNIFYSFNEYEMDIINKKKYKVSNMDFFTNNQLRIELKIKQTINNFSDYFYLSNDCSNLVVTDIDDESETLTNNISINNNSILLEYDNRGTISLKNHLIRINNPYNYILKIMQSYKGLLNIMSLLVCNNLVHNFINLETILNDKYDNILLSDFSVSLDLNNRNIQYFEEFFSCYDPTYIEWPLELHILSFMFHYKLTSLSILNIEKIIDEYSKENIINNFGASVVSLYKKEALKYFNKYVNKSIDFIFTDIINFYYSWDNYALSMTFLKILIKLHKSINQQNKFIILFMKLLVCNVKYSPENRLTIQETLIQFNSFIKDIDPSIYRKLCNSLILTSARTTTLA
jgi:hypothetical protein